MLHVTGQGFSTPTSTLGLGLKKSPTQPEILPRWRVFHSFRDVLEGRNGSRLIDLRRVLVNLSSRGDLDLGLEEVTNTNRDTTTKLSSLGIGVLRLLVFLLRMK